MSLSPQFTKKNGVLLDNTDNFNGTDNYSVLFASGVYPEVKTWYKINTALGDGTPNYSADTTRSATPTPASVIFWGDGTGTLFTSGVFHNHLYSVGGVYEIGYRGGMERMRFSAVTFQSSEKLIDFLQFEETGFQRISTFDVFKNCSNIVDFTASGYPRSTSGGVLTGAGRLFVGCTLWNGDLSEWDVSGVTTFQETFRNCPAFNNASIANWVIPPATVTEYMFSNTPFNQDLSNWDMSTVTTPTRMFYLGTSNPTGLEGWDTSEFISMRQMFAYNAVFNRDITAWNTSKVVDFRDFMAGTNAFSGWDLSTKVINPGTPDEYVAWDVSAGTSFRTVFTGTAAPTSLRNWRFTAASGSFASPFLQTNSAFDADVSEWEMPPVSFATNNMFKSATAFTGGDMTTKVVNPGTPDEYTAWDMTLNTSLAEMFRSCSVFNGDISNWNTGNVTSMLRCFESNSLFNSDISGWDTSQVTNMSVMFSNCSSFDRDISGWNVGAVTNMRELFRGANSMSYDLSSWNMSSVEDMTLFCGVLMNFNYGAWNLASLVNISGFSVLSFANSANSMIGWAGNATTNTGVTANGIFSNSRVLSKTATVGVDGYDGQDAYNGFLKLIAPTPNANRTTGTNTSTGTDLLIDSGATFTASVNEGDVVANTTAGTYSSVVSVDSDTQLTLEDDIFTSTSQAYSVDGGFGWVLTGTSFT